MWARRNSMPMSLPYQGKDVSRQLERRDVQQEPVAATAASKVMITATTYMTMMVYETQKPVPTAGRVGTDILTTPANPIPQPLPTAAANAQTTNATSPLSTNRKPGSYPLSESTEHVLIAASAIGATILLVFIIYLIYRLRQGTPLRDIFKSLKAQPSTIYTKTPKREPGIDRSVSAPLGGNWGAEPIEKPAWDAETSFAGSSVNGPSQPLPPNRAFLRPGTNSSNRPLLTGSQTPSFAPFPPPNRRSRSAPPNMPLPPDLPVRASGIPSGTPSSPVLPVERLASQSEDTKSTNESSIPPYLAHLVNGSPASPPKVSRFSWTNSQAPKTPMDPRFSIASSTASIPRYRTVESWVGQQADRIEDQRAQANIRRQIEEAIREVNEASGVSPKVQYMSPPSIPRKAVGQNGPTGPPAVPNLPAEFQYTQKQPVDIASTSLPPPPEVPLKNAESEEAKRRHLTQGSDAPIFKAHPGTEVQIPRTFIPSVILDGKISPNAF